MMSTEADTCRKYVLPRLYAAGWNQGHAAPTEAGRLPATLPSQAHGGGGRGQDLAQAPGRWPAAGQGLRSSPRPEFTYSTNGHGIVEHDFLTGAETTLDTFPTPGDLWKRPQPAIGLGSDEQSQRFLAPSLPVPGKPLRYYQEIAINRVIRSILGGQRRVLINMATGTGKTDVAFHICRKLWNTRWNRAGEPRRPRILFLSDRSILVDDPKDKQFAPFGEAGGRPGLGRWCVQSG